jgi:succinate-semialdehyde dehydrogenase / glutarate-semialdehyde dehydrogenase
MPPSDDPATLHIDGRWEVAASTFEVRDPATLEVVGHCADAGADAAARAADAAAAAFPAWAAVAPHDRAGLMERTAAAIEADAPALTDLLMAESGKPRQEAAREVAGVVACLRWYAEEGRRVRRRTTAVLHSGTWLSTFRHPVGPVCAVAPWNYPLSTLARKLAPALAAGCTVLMKPAPETPLCTVELVRRAEAEGSPRGVLNLVTTTRAADVVGTWVADARVRKIAFTGSTEVGKALFRGAADTMKRLSLELGGHAPALVFDDADLDRAADAIVASRFRHAGQTCICVQRVYVQDSVHGRFVAMLAERTARLKVGNGRDDGVDLGPLIHEQALRRVAEHLEDALARGAILMAGGHRLHLPDPDRGFFFAPTLLDNATPAMRFMREETFGPLLGVGGFTAENEAVTLANSTPYGLVAYLFTANATRADRVVQALEFGTVSVNTTQAVALQLPFGGLKDSGIGKENGTEGLDQYLETRSLFAADTG